MRKAMQLKIKDLVAVFSVLEGMLRECGDTRFYALAETVSGSIAQMNELLAGEVDAKIVREMLKGLRQGLRELPQLLASIAPDRSEELIEDLEARLGRRFIEYL